MCGAAHSNVLLEDIEGSRNLPMSSVHCTQSTTCNKRRVDDYRNVTDPDFPEGASTPNEGIQPNILAIFPRKLREIKQKLERRVWGTRAQHPLRSTLVKNHSTIYVIYCCPLIPDKELRRSPIPLKISEKGC